MTGSYSSGRAKTNHERQAQLKRAINGTSNNTNSVSTLDTAFADPDMEALRQKLNEMILSGRRSFPNLRGPGSVSTIQQASSAFP